MSAVLRCKFYVLEIARIHSDARRLKLTAVIDQTDDNKSWSKFTPSGSFEITVTNEAVFEKIDAMKPGDYYYLDLTPANG